jgi:hypothetical protein
MANESGLMAPPGPDVGAPPDMGAPPDSPFMTKADEVLDDNEKSVLHSAVDQDPELLAILDKVYAASEAGPEVEPPVSPTGPSDAYDQAMKSGPMGM